MGPGGLAAEGLDAAHAGGDGAFAADLEETDLAGPADVGAAAKLHRVAVEGAGAAADLHDAHRISVFVAEELHHVGAALDLGVGHARSTRPDRRP